MGGNFIFFIAMSWIAIAWHRFILLEETSNQLFPNWNPSRIILYSIKTLVMVFTIAFIIIIPFALIITILTGVGLIAILPFINILLFISFYFWNFSLPELIIFNFNSTPIFNIILKSILISAVYIFLVLKLKISNEIDLILKRFYK